MRKPSESYLKLKKATDKILSGAGLVILSPVFAGIAIAIKLEDGITAPVFFKQKRVGIHKSHFMLYKFRSMQTDTPHDTPAPFADRSGTVSDRNRQVASKNQSG